MLALQQQQPMPIKFKGAYQSICGHHFVCKCIDFSENMYLRCAPVIIMLIERFRFNSQAYTSTSSKFMKRFNFKQLNSLKKLFIGILVVFISSITRFIIFHIWKQHFHWKKMLLIKEVCFIHYVVSCGE